jgi:hypothetical protein
VQYEDWGLWILLIDPLTPRIPTRHKSIGQFTLARLPKQLHDFHINIHYFSLGLATPLSFTDKSTRAVPTNRLEIFPASPMELGTFLPNNPGSRAFLHATMVGISFGDGKLVKPRLIRPA